MITRGYCSIQLEISESQLTNSYVSEGLEPPDYQFSIAMLARNWLIEGTQHIFLAYVSGQCKGISPQNISNYGLKMVQCLDHLETLEFPWVHFAGPWVHLVHKMFRTMLEPTIWSSQLILQNCSWWRDFAFSHVLQELFWAISHGSIHMAPLGRPLVSDPSIRRGRRGFRGGRVGRWRCNRVSAERCRGWVGFWPGVIKHGFKMDHRYAGDVPS